MRIYAMTATFGKLEHETLELQPGLNVICAPNEWGKSTWCAFLLAMLYGMDTRAKSTKTALADKERYAPWSGSPMAGRIDLNWDGRDITIERATKGRIPLGEFRAWETASGLPVEELNGDNCGQKLLGVEQEVFRRTGFIRLNELPVTRNEALRAKLSALVTTGDDSTEALVLAEKLKELKNKCRYNRTGLLPQAMEQCRVLENRLRELEGLEQQTAALQNRQEQTRQTLKTLENHRTALEYQKALADADLVREAELSWQKARNRAESLEISCRKLPDREKTAAREEQLSALRTEADALGQEREALPPEPEKPQVLQAFQGLNPQEALDRANGDAKRDCALRRKYWFALLIPAAVGLLGGGLCLRLGYPVAGLAAMGAGVLFLTLLLLIQMKRTEACRQIAQGYGTPDSDAWYGLAVDYGRESREYGRVHQLWCRQKEQLEGRQFTLRQRQERLCGSKSLEEALTLCRRILEKWDLFDAAQREAEQLEKHWQMLAAMASRSVPPEMPDSLTLSGEQTGPAIQKTREQLEKLRAELGTCRGKMEALGDASEIRRQLSENRSRVKRLEKYYDALTIAQETLAEATQELQRRFAPQISKRAQELLGKITDGRYDRLALSEDFSLRAGARQEDILHEALWRSEGTVDQLYLALRLAVSEVLSPDTPLVLDDALARFDDARMEAALRVLTDLGERRQIILFSCQQREAQAVNAENGPK